MNTAIEKPNTPYRNSRLLILVEDVAEMGTLPVNKQAVIVSRAPVKVAPRPALKVPSSDDGIVPSGGKCVHGVYIPVFSAYVDHAPYCSICCPYEIFAKEGTTYKA
jgi:hypothetical protein